MKFLPPSSPSTAPKMKHHQINLDLQRLAEARVRVILDTLSSGVLVLRNEGEIVDANSAAERLFEYPPEGLIGMDFMALLSEPLHSAQGATLTEHERHGSALSVSATTREVWGIRSTGERFPAEIALSYFEFAGEVFCNLMVKDLTEQQRLSLRLTQAHKFEAVGQLATGIAHEISGPLQFVGTNLEFLRSSNERLFQVIDSLAGMLENPSSTSLGWSQAAELLQRVEYANLQEQLRDVLSESLIGVKQVFEIVRALNHYAHPGTAEKVMVDLNQLIQHAVALSRHRWKQQSSIRLILDPAMPEIPLLPAELTQVLLNLICNACDAIGEKAAQGTADYEGVISITASRVPDSACIVVEDNGCGIDPHNLTRIFEPFFTTKRIGEGTGQGLSMCHKIILSHHQGTIEAASELGVGTRIRMTLPFEP